MGKTAARTTTHVSAEARCPLRKPGRAEASKVEIGSEPRRFQRGAGESEPLARPADLEEIVTAALVLASMPVLWFIGSSFLSN